MNPTDPEDTFRAMLHDWLERRGWLPARLAEAAEVSASLLSKWMADDPRRRVRPSPANLEKLAPVLDIAYEDLLRMLGYLPGEVTLGERDEIEADINARLAEYKAAVRGTPPQFWAPIIRATFDRMIGEVKDIDRLVRDVVPPDGPDGPAPRARRPPANRGLPERPKRPKARRHRPIEPPHLALAIGTL